MNLAVTLTAWLLVLGPAAAQTTLTNDGATLTNAGTRQLTGDPSATTPSSKNWSKNSGVN